MTLILRPLGRGNWCPVCVHIDDSRHSPRPLDYVPGTVVILGGQRYRIVRVEL